ncbi:MAG TPA: alginate export family protein [Pseudomonadales bacterium]|nr:alginate export family protein [Pseudomonadales bacterium]
MALPSSRIPRRGPIRFASRTALLTVLLTAMTAAPAVFAAPPRLADAIDTGPHLSLSGAVRSRYEQLDSSFRIAGVGAESVLATRTSVTADLRMARLTGRLELLDTRATAYDDARSIDTGLVNVLEPVNAWLGMRLGGDAADEGVLVRAGRTARNLGSRRLLARPGFRNTANTFTGVDARWQSGATTWTALAYLPDDRRPLLPEVRDGSRFQLDEFDTERRLLGLFTTTRLGAKAGATDHLELYVLHLHESDSAETPTTDRRLFTPGVRWWRPPAPAAIDWELELIAQFGTSRATPLPSDRRDLDHRAAFVHAQVGWTSAAPTPLRISLELEYASGDEDPDDGDNQRFTQLFGVTAGDTGPTSIYTAFPHANLVIGTLRFATEFDDRVDAELSLRTAALAQSRDAWVGTGLRDRTGNSGRDLGDQVELQVRWWLVPGTLHLEAGALHLDKGAFAREAPGAPSEDSVTYSWLALEFVF